MSLADVVERTGLPEETIERLIRTGALDSLGRPRRELLWQLREVAGATRGRIDGRTRSAGSAAGHPCGRRTADGPATARRPRRPALPAITESERLGDAYAVVGLDAKRQVVALFRDALDRLGAVPNAALADRRPGRVRLGGLVVTRQHPMTAKGTVFLALEDETGMVNVTLWPDTWARLRGVVRRHALLLVDGELQRESNVVNVVAHEIVPLTTVAERPAARNHPPACASSGTPACAAWASAGSASAPAGAEGLRLAALGLLRLGSLPAPAGPAALGSRARGSGGTRPRRRRTACR